MARGYGRRIRRRIRRFRRRARRGSRRGFARMVKRIAYTIPEKKYFDFSFQLGTQIATTPPNFTGYSSNALAADWTNQISLVNFMQQGYAEGQRIGNRIHVKYVQFTLIFAFSTIRNNLQTQADPGPSVNGMICRYMMLLDRNPAGTTYPRSNMEDPGTISWTPFAGATAVTLYTARQSGWRDYNMLRRFKVLVDLQHQSYITSGPLAAGNNTQLPLTGNHVAQHYVPINRDFTFTGSSAIAGGGGSVMQDNDILLQACPSEAGCCTVYGLARVCYNDC